jgi:Hereditary spastic paraplegia protein strumpellin
VNCKGSHECERWQLPPRLQGAFAGTLCPQTILPSLSSIAPAAPLHSCGWHFCCVQKHMAHLEALYRLYERIVAYHGQLTAFFRQLREGAYIQATIESMLLVQSPWSHFACMLSWMPIA